MAYLLTDANDENTEIEIYIEDLIPEIRETILQEEAIERAIELGWREKT